MSRRSILGLGLCAALAYAAYDWTGKNVDDVRGGIFQGINKVNGAEIESKGGFVELSWKATDRITAYAGVSRDNPDNEDVGSQGRAENRIWYAALRWNFKPVTIGLEFLDWTTKYVDLGDGHDHRVVGYIQYGF